MRSAPQLMSSGLPRSDALSYRFGPFRLDASRQLLYADDELVTLPPRLIRALILLVRNHGKELNKDYLLDELWPGTAVAENNLTVIISLLRKALGEGPEDHAYIVTIPGIGYRFVAEVEELNPPAHPGEEFGAVANRETSTELPSLKSRLPLGPFQALRLRQRRLVLGFIAFFVFLAVFSGWTLEKRRTVQNGVALASVAVLPFRPLGPGSDDDYLGLGMADALITRLQNIPHLAVRSTADVLRFQNSAYDPKTIGRDLNVTSLLDGAVKKEGDHVTLQVRLLRVSDGSVLWSDALEGKFTDLFAIQESLVAKLRTVLVLRPEKGENSKQRRQYQPDPEAYQFYIRGNYLSNERNIGSTEKSIDYFQRAIAKDPQFALPYASLAFSYIRHSGFRYTPAAEVFPKVEAAASKALSLDNDLVDAHLALALSKMYYHWDFPAAEAEFRRAIELEPNSSKVRLWFAIYLVTMGRTQEAQNEVVRVHDLEPFSLKSVAWSGQVLFLSRRFNEATQPLISTVEFNSDPSAWYLVWLRDSQSGNRNIPEIADPTNVIPSADPACRDLLALYSGALRGRSLQTQRCLGDLKGDRNRIDLYKVALIYAALGDKQNAFRTLEKAKQCRSWELVFLKVDPRFDSLRQDPRFSGLLQSIGFPG